jgi:hypothetical protein
LTHTGQEKGKMKIGKVAATAILCSLVLVMSVSLATAATAKHCTLKVTDINNAEKINFNFGETVYIAWVADGTVDITVENDATSATAYSKTDAPSSGSDSFIPPTPGDYTIYVNGKAAKTVDIDTFFVVPEYPIGTLGAICVGLAAIGTITIAKRNKK